MQSSCDMQGDQKTAKPPLTPCLAPSPSSASVLSGRKIREGGTPDGRRRGGGGAGQLFEARGKVTKEAGNARCLEQVMLAVRSLENRPCKQAQQLGPSLGGFSVQVRRTHGLVSG